MFFDVAVMFIILIAIGFAYGQVLSHQFVAWDDVSYVSENPRVLTGLSWDNVVWAFSTIQLSNWHPVTLLSHMLDVSLWGKRSGMHAAVNVAFHAVNALLLYAFINRLNQGGSGSIATRISAVVVSFLFAVHPLHVESVAWISERKDVLCAFFWLLAMHSYLDYARRPSVLRYSVTTAWIVLSLLSKPMAVTLPLVLLILDWWPLQRAQRVFDFVAKRLIIEKLPWIGLAIGVAYLTAIAQKNAMPTLLSVERAQVAIAAYGWYLEKTFWPTQLHFYYLTENAWSGARLLISTVVLLFVSFLAYLWRHSRPAFLAGWVWFILTLLPVVGFVKVGTQAWADRYTYLPHIGLFWMFVSVLPHRGSPRYLKVSGAAALAMVTIVLTFLSWRQVATWKDTTTLYRHALAQNTGHYVALMGLANQALRQQEYASAQVLAERALSLSSGPALVRSMSSLLGDVELEAGNLALAIQHYESGRDADRLDEGVRIKLGVAYMNAGRLNDSELAFREATLRAPDSVDALNGLGVVLGLQRRWAESFSVLERGISLAPTHRGLRHNLASTALRSGDFARARKIYSDLLSIYPEDSEAREALSALAEQSGGA